MAILSIFGSGNSPKSIEVLDSECSSRHPGLDCPPLKALGEIVRAGAAIVTPGRVMSKFYFRLASLHIVHFQAVA